MKNIVLVCDKIPQSSNRQYNHTHINIMRNMLNRAGAEYDRLIVLTNEDKSLIHSDFEVIPLEQRSKIWWGWWCKIQMYNKNLNIDGDILYLDLDVIPLKGINRLWEYAPGEVAMRQAVHLDNIQDIDLYKRYTTVISSGHKYNTSIQRFTQEQMHWLYELYTQPGSHISQEGDELFVCTNMYKNNKSAAVFPLEWCPFYCNHACDEPNPINWKLNNKFIPERSDIDVDISVLTFAGGFKPWTVSKYDQSVQELYQ